MCWKCGKDVGAKCAFFCSCCDAIQPPPRRGALTHFELLQQPATFDINLKAMEAEYHELQKRLHPDRFGQGTMREQEYSAALSSIVNAAYALLKQPAERAQYLLELNGIDAIGEASRAGHADAALLMEVMEIREAIVECASAARLQQLAVENDARVRSCIADVVAAFRTQPPALERARALTVRLQYLTKIAHEITEWEERR